MQIDGGWGYLLTVLLLAFRDENHLGRIIAYLGSIEISVQRRDLESAAREQVLDLIAEEIPQGPRKDEPLLAAAGMHHGIDHLHVIDLLRAMERRHPLTDPHLSAIPGLVFRDQRLPHVHGIV